MNRRSHPSLVTAALALVISAAILAGTTLDAGAPTPLDEARAVASHTELAQRLDAIELRVDRAALDICAEEKGPGATAHWTGNSELICHAAPEPGAIVTVLLEGATQ